MRRKLTRGEFCAVLGITSQTLDNRTFHGQLPLFLGLETPAVYGEYHRGDVVTGKFADAMVGRGFAREVATDILNENPEEVLEALTRHEWEPSAACYDSRGRLIGERAIYFAIARTVDGRTGAVKHRVAVGLHDQALGALTETGAAWVADLSFVPVGDVVADTLDAFEQADLNEFLTRPTGETDLFTRHPVLSKDYKEWAAEIEQLRKQSKDRMKARARLKRERQRDRAKA